MDKVELRIWQDDIVLIVS